MKLRLLAGILLLSIVAAAVVARADDCAGKLTDQEQQTFASIIPAHQQAMVNLKMKNGSSATCEFRAGLLDMLANFPPQDRDAGFQHMLDKTFVKQNRS